MSRSSIIAKDAPRFYSRGWLAGPVAAGRRPALRKIFAAREDFDVLYYMEYGVHRLVVCQSTIAAVVAQVSKPVVSPTSKSAERPQSCNLRVWKPATQQTCPSPLRFAATAPEPKAKAGKSALRGLRLRREVIFCG
jgi:hypothetical protein